MPGTPQTWSVIGAAGAMLAAIVALLAVFANNTKSTRADENRLTLVEAATANNASELAEANRKLDSLLDTVGRMGTADRYPYRAALKDWMRFYEANPQLNRVLPEGRE